MNYVEQELIEEYNKKNECFYWRGEKFDSNSDTRALIMIILNMGKLMEYESTEHIRQLNVLGGM